jgi:hypothetical protein
MKSQGLRADQPKALASRQLAFEMAWPSGTKAGRTSRARPDLASGG